MSASITIVGLGSGDPGAVPVAAVEASHEARTLIAPELATELITLLGREPDRLGDIGALPNGAIVVATDLEAHRLAQRLPDAATIPNRSALRTRAIAAAVGHLVEVGTHLRTECPWDREQTAASIVPHTIEEAFEVAEAVAAGDAERQADEVGDLLFQAVFLAQLLEETGDGDLGEIADAHASKLIARHPHVYGEAVAETAGGVRDLWERQKREGRGGGIFHELPAGLPALAYATKAQRRAASVGFEFAAAGDALAKLDEEVGELHAEPGDRELGDVLFACVAVARSLKADPELALRGAAQRFRARVELAAELAAAGGESFHEAEPAAQLRWYEEAKLQG